MERTLSHAARNALLSAATSVGLLVAALVPTSQVTAQQGDCLAQAGTLTGFKPTDCLQEGGTQIGGVPNGDHFTPPGYIRNWVLTKGPGLVIVDAGYSNIFTVTETGLYTVHTLIYDPATLDLGIVEFGVTTGFDVNSLLIQGGGSICASLDVTGTSILVDNPDAGSLTSMDASVCLSNGEATLTAMVNDAPYVPAGYSVVYVLTEGAGLTIVNASGEPSFTVSQPGNYTIHTLVYDPATLDLGVVDFGTTTGFDVNGLLIQGGGAICAALDVPGATFEVTEECPCEANAGTLSGFKPTDCLQDGGTMIGGIANGDAVVPPGYSTLYVLTQGPGLVIVDAGPSPIFIVNSVGSYTVHTLVYDPATLDLSIVEFGVTTGFDVNSLLIQGGGSICASLDVTGTTILVDNPDAGSLSAVLAEVCLNDGSATVSATVNDAPYVPTGYQVAYVLTQGPGLVIVNAGAEPAFDVNTAGTYTIHTLVYDPATLDLSIVELGVTTGFDVNGLLIQGGGEICAALDVAGAPVSVVTCDEECTANAGTLTADLFELCLEDGSATVSATANGDAVVPAGYSVVYVLTQGADLVIVDAGTAPSFTVTTPGTYTVHTLVYDPATLDLSIVEFGVTTGVDVNGLLIQGGGSICASLDVAGAPVTVLDCPPTCEAFAGTITPAIAQVCLAGPSGNAFLEGVPSGDAVVPAGFSTLYVLTRGPELTIVGANVDPFFSSVEDEGVYTIHTLIYDPATLDLSGIVPGSTTGFDVNALLIQGGGDICASLDVAGAQITVSQCDFCTADAGTLSATDTTLCISGGLVTLFATPNGDAVVPAGYQTVYVLTRGPELVVVNAGLVPSFTVNAPGTYTIHGLVFNPATVDLGIVQLGVTTGFDVNALLVQGGGTICGSLDVPGAAFEVSSCDGQCDADAGTLTALATNCFDGSALLEASPNGDAVVPNGYSVVYVLTQGEGLTIVNTALQPQFVVNEVGQYTIHTLVYDATTLDLSIVELGVTTGFDVNALLIQGGGAICASLDVAGASFNVVPCGDCEAAAGTLTAFEEAVCLTEGEATFGADPNGNAIVPAGYEVLYVLTSGSGLIIEQVNTTPVFTVADTGSYTIHTLVYDPATLDLSIVQFGITSGVDVNSLLIQGGGTICASLDVAGAPVEVVDCNTICNVNAGTLTATASQVCLTNGSASISATPNNDAFKPAGFERIFVLTQGPELVIVNASVTPSFVVDAPGLYTIHTLAFNPSTISLGSIQLGVTTGFDVNALLVQGGGSICGSLDVAGAPVQVNDCNDLSAWPNPAYADLTLELESLGTGRMEVDILDMQGARTTLSTSIAADQPMHRIDVSDLRPGQYILRVTSSSGVRTVRFSKVDR